MGVQVVPSMVQVGPYDYSVVVEEIEKKNDRPVFGECDPKDQFIRLDPSQGPDHMAETMLHEVIHCIWYMVDLPLKDEERIISVLSPALLDTLRRNWSLNRYLLKM